MIPKWAAVMAGSRGVEAMCRPRTYGYGMRRDWSTDSRLAVAAIDDAGGAVDIRLKNPETPFSGAAAALVEFLIDFGNRHFFCLLFVVGDQGRVIDLFAQ